jgi:thiosulfate/3-mercaptopyruvate sulfurtransferase
VEAFEGLGVSDGSRIVLYFAKDWITPTTRVWFTLDYMGLGERTSILDGGMAAWVAAGHPVTKGVAPPPTARGRISPKPRPEIVADAEYVKANLAKPPVVVVDSRLPQFHDGREKGMMPRGGRIPGARSLPFDSLVGSDNRLKEKGELRELFTRAGVSEGATVVTYCHIGQQASLGYFAARYLGYRARLYDGSFEEWSRRAELPVEAGAK